MSVGRTRTPHRDALEKATQYATEAEHLDSAGKFDDRDVRLWFAQVWAQIATAARPTCSGHGSPIPKETS